MVHRLKGNLPVLVKGAMWEDAAEELDDRVVGDAEIWCPLDHLCPVRLCHLNSQPDD